MIENIGYGWFVVKCPHCGSDCSHQGATTVRHRRDPEGDGPGTALTLSRDDVESTKLEADAKEWKGRRDDVEIEIACEQCPSDFRLVIRQHKGQTQLRVDTGPNDRR